MAAAADGPVGVIPPGADPESYDRMRRRVLWRLPSGLYLLGSRSGDARNLMTLSWAMQVATEPKMVAVGVETSAHTHDLLMEGSGFALSLLRRADRAVVRAFVKPAVWDSGSVTLNGHAVFEATTGAPVLTSAVAWLDCRVQHRVACGSHTLFVGEVVDAGESVGGTATAHVVGPVGAPGPPAEILRMEDTRMSYGG